MISMSTVFIIGGAGITLGLLDSILRSMGKEEISMIINVIAIGGLGFYTITLVDKLFKALMVFL